MQEAVESRAASHLEPASQGGEDLVQPPQSTTDEETLQFVRQLALDLQKGEFELPPFPDTAIRVQACVRDPNSDNQTLAAIIATEPALAARLMRMANSVMVRRGPIEVTDIPTAISRVGMEMVQNTAVSFAAREAFKAPAGSPISADLAKLRKISVTVAAISYLLASHVRDICKPDEAMLAGLLNSVGKFYIFMRSSDHPGLFADRRALDQLLAQWHTGVARAIVESWEFSETIAHAVDEQELKQRDREAPADLSDILFVGNLIARAGVDAAPHLGDLDALARLGLDADELHALLCKNEEEIQSMVAAMT